MGKSESHLFRLIKSVPRRTGPWVKLPHPYTSVGIVLALTFVAMPPGKTMAQIRQGNITVFADAEGVSCVAEDLGPANFTLYVLHTNMAGTYVSHFRVVESSGFKPTYVGESIPFAHMGDLRNGVSIAYGGCVDGPLLLGVINYIGQGTSEPCSTVDTTGNPNWPGIPTAYALTEDCDFNVLPAPSLGFLYVNPQSACQPWCVVGTQSATWGKVKALYRQ